MPTLVLTATQRPRRSSSPTPWVTGSARRPGKPGVPPSSRDSPAGPTHPGRPGPRPVPPSRRQPPPLRPPLPRSRRPRSQRRAETAAGRARAGRTQEIPARFRGSAAAAARGGSGEGEGEGGGERGGPVARARSPGRRARYLGARRPVDAAGPGGGIAPAQARALGSDRFPPGPSASQGLLHTGFLSTRAVSNRSFYASRCQSGFSRQQIPQGAYVLGFKVSGYGA